MPNDEVIVKIGNSEAQELETNPTEQPQEEGNEMELTLGGEEEMEQMEEIVGDKVQQEQDANESQKGKRGPKGPRNQPTPADGETTEIKDKEKADLKSVRIMEREIKRGTVVCPQGRIEKMEDGRYKMLLVPELTTVKEKMKFEEVGITDKLNDGKWEISCIAAELFGPKYKVSLDGKSLVTDGEGVTHDYVRVELHKPGRDKDVVEAYTTGWALGVKKATEEKNQRKEKADKDKEKTEAEATAAEATA